jgi:hypothetical protein
MLIFMAAKEVTCVPACDCIRPDVLVAMEAPGVTPHAELRGLAIRDLRFTSGSSEGVAAEVRGVVDICLPARMPQPVINTRAV